MKTGKSRRWQKSPFLGVGVVDEVLHQAVVGRVVAAAAGDGGQCATVRFDVRRIHVAPKLAISLTDTLEAYRVTHLLGNNLLLTWF